MQLFYNRDFTGQGQWALSSAQSHHCINVMRMTQGDSLWISDGKGGLFDCRIVLASSKETIVQSVGERHEYGKRPYTLDLAVAPTKNIDRIEWLVEKATEIGIDSFTPLLCEHSERKVVKEERLAKIIESAAAQSQKAYLPRLNELTSFKKYVTQNPGGLIAHCIEGETKTRMSACGHYTILIGPEGDFSPAELALAIGNRYEGLSLGSQRLRTETAALYAVAAAAVINC